MHPDSVFGHVGIRTIFPDDMTAWNALSYTNSHLFTYT